MIAKKAEDKTEKIHHLVITSVESLKLYKTKHISIYKLLTVQHYADIAKMSKRKDDHAQSLKGFRKMQK